MDRVGGYDWLGGEVEAALSALRAAGCHDSARDWASSFSSREKPDMAEFRMKAFWEQAKNGGLEYDDYQQAVAKNAVALDRLRDVFANEANSSQALHSPALLVLPAASESDELQKSATSRCAQLEVAKVRGQDDTGDATADAVRQWMVQTGFLGAEAQRCKKRLDRRAKDAIAIAEEENPGLVIVREGQGPTKYFVHDLGGGAPAGLGFLKSKVEQRENCRCAVLLYDDEARLADAEGTLPDLYNRRIIRDMIKLQVQRNNATG